MAKCDFKRHRKLPAKIIAVEKSDSVIEFGQKFLPQKLSLPSAFVSFAPRAANSVWLWLTRWLSIIKLIYSFSDRNLQISAPLNHSHSSLSLITSQAVQRGDPSPLCPSSSSRCESTEWWTATKALQTSLLNWRACVKDLTLDAPDSSYHDPENN